MIRQKYVVTEKGAAQKVLLGRNVVLGQELWLTDGEATTPLLHGMIGSQWREQPEESVKIIIPPSQGKSTATNFFVFHPLDHDHDGRKGGSEKGRRGRRKP